jgi:hypothetical protein
MKKFKLLRFGRCYINREGNFAIGLLSGDREHGYQFVCSHANPNIWFSKFQLLSRIVPNDGSWIEISHLEFNVASALRTMGHVAKFPADKLSGKLPLISKKY